MSGSDTRRATGTGHTLPIPGFHNVSRAAPHALALLVHGLIAVYLTWPIAQNIRTHALGLAGDNMGGIHTLYWFWHELSQGHWPWSIDLMAYPRTTVVFHPSIAMELISAPLSALWGPVAAFNLLTLISFTLCGYTTFLLVRRLTDSVPVAIAAGALFTATGPHQFDLLFNTNAVWALPWACLAFLRWRERPERWWEVALACSVLALCNFYFAGYYLPLLFAAFIPWRRLRDMRVLLSAAAAAAATLAVCVLAYIPPILAAGSATRDTLGAVAAAPGSRPSTEVLGMFIGSPQHPRWGSTFASWGQGLDPTQAPNTGSVYLGLVTLALAFVGVRRAWRTGPWIPLGLAAGILMLGPELLVNGKRLMPLPYGYIDAIPLLSFLRAPSRFYYVLSICLVVLAAFGLWAIAGWVKQRTPNRAKLGAAVVSVIAALGVYEQVFRHPVPITPVAVPNAYQLLATLPGRPALIEVPGGGFNDYQWLAYQHVSHLPLVNDASPRATWQEPIPLYQNPFLHSTVAGPATDGISEDEEYARQHKGALIPERVEGAKELGRMGVTYAVLHHYTIFGWPDPTDNGYKAYRRYLERYLGAPVYEDEAVALYALPGARGLDQVRTWPGAVR